MTEVKVYAHRGASGYEMENTWNSFYKACEMGVGIELDVQITKDGVVLVYHDDNLKRLCGRNVNISEVLYEEIKGLTVKRKKFRKSGSYQIPLAYEVFQWAKEKTIPLNVELKNSFSLHPEATKILAAMLEGIEDLHVSSFDPVLLRSMKKNMPNTETALIIKKKTPLAAIKDADWIDSIHFHKRLYSVSRFKSLGELGKNIRIYGVRGSEKLFSNLGDKLVGIITDYPDRVKEKLGLPGK